MISSFFSQSKPINYVAVSLLMLIVFVAAKYMTHHGKIDAFIIGSHVGLFGVCLLTIFIFDFLATRNKLIKKNSYNILLFTLFIAVLPETILNTKTLLAHFFIVLAIRRIISLRTAKDIKKKLFDAAFWISIATLLFFWSGLFFLMIIIALFVYTITDVKNWIIPIIGVLTVAIITASYLIIMDINMVNYLKTLVDFSLDFSLLNSKRIIIGATILFSFGAWSLFYYIKNIKSKSKSLRPSFTLVIVAAILGLIIIVVAPNKNGSEFIFLFVPLAIIMTNYLEVISEKWFKEVLLWVLLLTPIVTLML